MRVDVVLDDGAYMPERAYDFDRESNGFGSTGR